jgi:hypothetical protein
MIGKCNPNANAAGGFHGRAIDLRGSCDCEKKKG